MEIYPSFLPAPSQAYRIEPESMVVANKFDAGPPVQRLRFDDEIDTIKLAWDLNESEFFMFKEWYATKLAFGTKKFTMDIPLGGYGGVRPYECAFDASKAYKAQYKPVNNWKVSAEIFVEDVEYMPESVLDILLEDYPNTGDTFVDAVDLLDNFVENQLP